MRLSTLQLAYVFAASLFTALAQVNLKRQFLRNELETLLKEDGPNRTDAVPVHLTPRAYLVGHPFITFPSRGWKWTILDSAAMLPVQCPPQQLLPCSTDRFSKKPPASSGHDIIRPAANTNFGWAASNYRCSPSRTYLMGADFDLGVNVANRARDRFVESARARAVDQAAHRKCTCCCRLYWAPDTGICNSLLVLAFPGYSERVVSWLNKK